MRKVFLILYSLFFSVVLSMAQTNPKPGYIITNSGDTIRGILDFRTNKMLAKRCDFWAEGESEVKHFKPGEIESFRFDHNGKYFVTRRLTVHEEPELYFAEFMVQGKMNLYCVADAYEEYFFFERDDGEMAKLTTRSVISSSSLQEVQEHKKEMKEEYGKVKLLLQDSWKAAEEMNGVNMTRGKLVNVVKEYHKDVCTDGSSCMVYEYKENADKMKSHFKLFGGYGYYAKERTVCQDLPDESYHGSTLELGFAAETDIERVMKGGSAEVAVMYSPKAKFEHDVMVKGGHSLSHTTYEKSRLQFTIGVVKRFGNKKVQPLARVGGFYTMHMGNWEERYYMGKKIVDQGWSNTQHSGLYVGGGAQIPVGKLFARIHADLYKSLFSKGNMMKIGITAEVGL